MGSVEGSTEGLLRFEQFPVSKAYEAHEVSGSVDMIIASTIFTNWQKCQCWGTWKWSWCSSMIFAVVPRVLNSACLKEISKDGDNKIKQGRLGTWGPSNMWSIDVLCCMVKLSCINCNAMGCVVLCNLLTLLKLVWYDWVKKQKVFAGQFWCMEVKRGPVGADKTKDWSGPEMQCSRRNAITKQKKSLSTIFFAEIYIKCDLSKSSEILSSANFVWSTASTPATIRCWKEGESKDKQAKQVGKAKESR